MACADDANCLSDDDDQGLEEEEQEGDADGPGWRAADVLNEAIPDLSVDLLSADERSIHMRLPLGKLTPAQAVAIGLHHGLTLDYRCDKPFSPHAC